jgi:integrase
VWGGAPAAEDLAQYPQAWPGITWEIVDGFVKWLLLQGFAIGTIKVRLSTVKTYARLAAEAGAISTQGLAMIRGVKALGPAEGKRVDKIRKSAGLPTRVGDKKAKPVALSKEQVAALKDQPDTPQGRRDALMVGLMLDLGLRVGEVASLNVEDVDLQSAELAFYRPNLERVQRHRLWDELHGVTAGYMEQDALAAGPLLRASNKDGTLTHAGMTVRAITKRVRALGQEMGIEDLSAQDLRHTWATWAARSGTPFDRLQDAGGWSSPEMPLRYVEGAAIANEGVRLDTV